MRKVLLVLCVLLLPTLASAQTNVKSPYKVNFCFDGKDQDGVTIVGAVQVILSIDGTAQAAVALPTSSGTTGCAAGSNKFTLPSASAKGSHSVTVTLSSSDGPGDPSSPFAFAVVGKPPSTPTAVSVTQ